MIVSIVTGTFNRIKYLKRMVETARFSVGVGFPYEFIIVDGGSTDGTIEWCKQQSDIKLIEHGALLGLIKAFNDGANAATGKYVILGNDDITFVNESIQRAVVHMEDNDDVGIGCFYQDRGNREWHVETMSAVINGKQSSTWYGQVCIVRRWLGDLVGWWGNYLKAYGGDNELSCNVLELGYKVEPVPCACIHDLRVDDDLRKINNGDMTLVAGKHPDTAAFYKKWTRNGYVGPVIQSDLTLYSEEKKHKRIVYGSIYEKDYAIQKITKRGLRDALVRSGYLVSELDYLRDPDYLYDLADAVQPDIFLLQLQDSRVYTRHHILELRALYPKAKLVNWNGDFHPENLLSRPYIELMKMFDVCLFSNTSVLEQYKREGINAQYWQVSYEGEDVDPLPETPKHDVIFIGNGYNQQRNNIAQILRSLPRSINVGLYGNWHPTFRSNGKNLYDFAAGHRLYKNAKIVISDIYPGSRGFVSNRLFQALYAGAFVLQQTIPDVKDVMGFVSGKHYVHWDDVQELPDLIYRYLNYASDERVTIAATGKKFVMEKHSFDARVKELEGILQYDESK